MDLRERCFVRADSLQVCFEILAGQLLQIQNPTAPFPEQVRTHQIKNRSLVMCVEGRQIERHRHIEFFDQRESPAVEIGKAVIKSDGHCPVGQVIRIEALNSFTEW